MQMHPTVKYAQVIITSMLMGYVEQMQIPIVLLAQMAVKQIVQLAAQVIICLKHIICASLVMEPMFTCNPPVIKGALTSTTYCVQGSYTADFCSPPLTGCAVPISTNLCQTCSPNYYLALNSTCVPCATGCSSCSDAFTCYACQSGYFMNLITRVCMSCGTNCTSCFSATNCTGCKSGNTLVGTSCKICTTTSGGAVCNCPYGYFWNGFACSSCGAGCAICTSAASCTQCTPNYYYNGVSCSQSGDTNCSLIYGSATTMTAYCQSCDLYSFWDTANQVCQNCSAVIPNCLTCTSLTSCNYCSSGYYLLSGQCSACSLPNCNTCSNATSCDQCASGSYWDTPSGQCLSCMNGCAACATGNACLFCAMGFYKDGNNVCRSCPVGCSACGSATGCITCMGPYYFDINSTLCLPCSARCATCGGQGLDQCMTCVTNSTFNDTSADGPLACNCVTGTFYNQSQNVCVSQTVTASSTLIFIGILTFFVLILAII